MSDKHSPTPWTYKKQAISSKHSAFAVFDGAGNYLTMFLSEADAKLICTAVNCNASTIAALRETCQIMQKYAKLHGTESEMGKQLRKNLAAIDAFERESK